MKRVGLCNAANLGFDLVRFKSSYPPQWRHYQPVTSFFPGGEDDRGKRRIES